MTAFKSCLVPSLIETSAEINDCCRDKIFRNWRGFRAPCTYYITKVFTIAPIHAESNCSGKCRSSQSTILTPLVRIVIGPRLCSKGRLISMVWSSRNVALHVLCKELRVNVEAVGRIRSALLALCSQCLASNRVCRNAAVRGY